MAEPHEMTDADLIASLKTGTAPAPIAWEAARRLALTQLKTRKITEGLQQIAEQSEEVAGVVSNLENALFRAAFVLAQNHQDYAAARAYQTAMGIHADAKAALTWVRNVQGGSISRPPVHKYEEGADEAS